MRSAPSRSISSAHARRAVVSKPPAAGVATGTMAALDAVASARGDGTTTSDDAEAQELRELAERIAERRAASRALARTTARARRATVRTTPGSSSASSPPPSTSSSSSPVPFR